MKVASFRFNPDRLASASPWHPRDKTVCIKNHDYFFSSPLLEAQQTPGLGCQQRWTCRGSACPTGCVDPCWCIPCACGDCSQRWSRCAWNASWSPLVFGSSRPRSKWRCGCWHTLFAAKICFKKKLLYKWDAVAQTCTAGGWDIFQQRPADLYASSSLLDSSPFSVDDCESEIEEQGWWTATIEDMSIYNSFSKTTPKPSRPKKWHQQPPKIQQTQQQLEPPTATSPLFCQSFSFLPVAGILACIGDHDVQIQQTFLKRSVRMKLFPSQLLKLLHKCATPPNISKLHLWGQQGGCRRVASPHRYSVT